MAIDSFVAEFRFLSNFHPSPVHLDGVLYPTVEHAYQAAKTDDLEERKKIRAASTPGLSKRLGRKVTMRSNWDSIKINVMHQLLAEKFRDPELADLLLETIPAQLIEGNT